LKLSVIDSCFARLHNRATMRAIFIADAHLNRPEDANYRLLLDFIKEQHGKTDMLCILGDLFDFRVGLASLNFAGHDKMLAALAALSRSGTRIIYLEGNHDFHLGKKFAALTGCELHRRPTEIRYDGKRIYLCHGDLINRSDLRYLLLYLLLHNRLTFFLAHLLPARLLHRLRAYLQKNSKKRYDKHQINWNYEEIIRGFASKKHANGYDAVVTGHFHLPFMEHENGFTLLSLGDWLGHFSYGCLENGLFSLQVYPDRH